MVSFEPMWLSKGENMQVAFNGTVKPSPVEKRRLMYRMPKKLQDQATPRASQRVALDIDKGDGVTLGFPAPPRV